MHRYTNSLLTALAPIIWGSTYYVTTEFLPAGYPITAAMLRALPAGLLLLLLVRELPNGQWWIKMAVLGALNFALFWSLLFISAYRLPGGVAATLGAIQPIFVIILARFWLKQPLHTTMLASACIGIAGVALLVLTPSAQLDNIGILAAIGGAISMAAGSVLTKKWQPPTSLLTYTSWQLTAGGLLLLPFAYYLEPPLPNLTNTNILGFAWLGLIGAALSYVIWFRGITKIDPSTISTLGFLSPLTAVILGWYWLHQSLSGLQILGVTIILSSIFISQYLHYRKEEK